MTTAIRRYNGYIEPMMYVVDADAQRFTVGGPLSKGDAIRT